MHSLRPALLKRLSVLVVAVLALTLLVWPASARAANSLTTSAVGVRANIGLLLGLAALNATEPSPVQTWSDGGGTSTKTTASVGLGALGTSILGTGAVTALAGPAISGGGRAQADVANVSLLGSAGVNTGAIRTICVMNATGITTTVDIANLKVGASTIANPDTNLAINLPGLAGVTIDKRSATWNTTTGQYDYTVRALDVNLLNGGLGLVANGNVVIAESKCSGTIKLGSITDTPVQLAPGQNGTPSVTLTNTGDAAAPNTTIKIPQPSSAYVLGTPTVNGGGSCTTSDPNYIICSGITVPGNGSVKVLLPVTLKSSASSSAANWSPGATAISATSVPVAAAPSATMTITGGGALVTAQPRTSTGGSITVTPTTLYAGKTATTGIKIANQGPSDATSTITIPIGNRPAGVKVESATVGGNACTVDAANITCTGVTVPGGGDVTVNVTTSAPVATAVGTTWDLAGITASLNGATVTGQGRLLTIGDPDVNLAGGVTVTPATAIPGGASATATVQVRNSGAIAASPTTITLPAPPAGYTVGAVTTTGGGSCTSGPSGISCTGVTIGPGQTVTVSVPVTLAAGVTAEWAAASGAPVTATAGDSTGTATGRIVTPAPRYTLGVTADGPPDGTVSPGQSTTITADVYNQGPSDAKQAKFVVVAPRDTTFGPLTGATANLCTAAALNTQLNCTADIAAGAAGLTLTLPVAVSPLADPATPVTGGCVSLDNDTTCTGPDDAKLPAIALRTPLANRLTTTFTPGVITPGSTGTGTLTLRSTQAETGMTVTIPTTALPAGFTLAPTSTATVPGGTCTVGASSIVCTGVALTANTPKDISVRVAVDQAVVPPKAWTAANVTVAAGNEQITTTGALAGTGTVNYTLSASATAPADNTVEPGGTSLTGLTVNVTNTGPSSAPTATFSVNAPAGTTFEPLSGTAASICRVSTNVLLLCSTSLAAGASTGALTIPLKVVPNADPDTPVSGGCVDVDGIPGCGAADKAIPTFRLKVPFSAQVAVTSDRADVTPGGTGTATVHVKATHNDLTGLAVTIPLTALPGGVTVTGVTGPNGNGTCTQSSGQIDCTGLSIINGATADIKLTVSAATNATAGTSWTATGITAGAGGQSITASQQELGRVTAAKPTLDAAVALAGLQAMPGGGGTLNVNVTNSGPSDAQNTPLTVIAPIGTTFGPLSGATATACTLSADASRANCRINLAANDPALALSLPVQISTNVLPGKAITGGCVDLDNSGTCTVAADKAIPSITIGTPLQQRLAVTTTPVRIVPGQEADAKLTLTSTGVESGLSVTIPTTGLPTDVSVTTATVPGGSCTGTSPIVCTGIALPTANQPVAVTLHVKALSSAVASTWTANGIGVASATETASATADLAVIGAPQSTLTGVVTVPAAATVGAGGTANVVVTVTNTGPSNASPAVFQVSAPTGTTFGTLPAGCVRTSDTLATCSVPLAAAAGTGALTFAVNVPAGADPFSPLTGGCVNLDGVAGCGADDQAIGNIVLRAPFDRLVTLTAAPGTVVPGRTGTATVTVTAEHGGLTNLTVTVPVNQLPADVTVAVPAGCTQANPAAPLICTGVNVAANAGTTITLTLTAASSATPGDTWDVTGLAVGNGVDTVTAARRLATVGPADVELDPAVAPISPIEPGRTGTVGVTIENTGDSDAVNARYGVIPPAGATFGTPPAGCAAVAGTNQLSCSVTLAAGAIATPTTFPLIVDAGANPGQTLTGGCVDLDNDGFCRIPPDRSLGPVTVATPFDRQVSVSTTPSTVTPGNSGTATVVITSTAAQGGPVTVTIPVGAVPGAITIDSPVTVDQGGTCVNAAGVITCTGIQFNAAGTATVSIPLTVDANAGGGVIWSTTGVQVENAANEVVGGGGILVRTGTPLYVLGATVVVPNPDTVLPGSTTTVTATVLNTGASAATGVPITLVAPTGTTFGAPPAGCTATSSTTMSCTVTLAANGGSVSLAVPVIVPAPAPAGPLTGGCVDLDGNGRCGDPGDRSIPAITLRSPLSAVLSVAGGISATVTPGRTGTATVQITGSATRNDMVLTVGTAGRPAGLTVTSANVGGTDCPVTNDVVRCADVDLASGATATLSLVLAADPTATPGLTWTPVVSLTQGVADTATLSRLAATVGPVDNGTGLAVTVTPPVDGLVLPGGSNILRIVMTNPGPSALAGARADFKAPTGTTFGTLDVPASNFCLKASSTLVTCTTDLGVEARAFRLPIDVPATATPGATVTGGCVDLDHDGACGSGDASIASFTLAKPFSAQAQLSLTVGTVVPGDVASGVVELTADRALTGLTATIPLNLPAGLTLIGASGPTGSTCTLTGTITCTGLAAPQATIDLITVTVRAASSMAADVTWSPVVTLTNSAGATSTGTGALIRTVAPVAALAFAATAPAGTVSPGSTANMTVTVTNPGPSNATGVVTRIKAPTGTTFAALSGTAAQNCQPVGNNQLDCAVTLAAGAAPLQWALPVLIPANADPGTAVAGGCIDSSRDGVCGSGDTPLPSLALTPTLAQAVTITATNPEITPGETGTITVHLAATRARTALAVSIPIGALPAGMTITQAQVPGGTCLIDADAVTCTGVDVATNGSTTISMNAEVAAGAAMGTSWTPTVTVTDGTQTTARTLTAAEVGPAVTDVSVAVSVPAPGELQPGQTGTLSATVSNTGSSTARGVTFAFLAPNGTTFVAPTGTTATMCAMNPARTRLDCTVDVPGNGRVQLPVNVLVDPAADQRIPLTGGCVDVGSDGTCTPGDDTAIPDILLALPLDDRIQFAATSATPAPGALGTGVVRLIATTAVTGATVTVPLAGLPAGVVVSGAAGPVGSTCAVGATEIRCTGVNLVAGSTDAVRITVRAGAQATPAAVWRPAVTVEADGQSATGDVDLLTVGPRTAAVTWKVAGADAPMTPGGTVTLTVTGSNAGPSDAVSRPTTIVAPTNTTFGPLTGRAAQDCTVTSTTVLTCTATIANGGSLAWSVPLKVDQNAAQGSTVTGGCVSTDGDAKCDGNGDVAIGGSPVNTPLTGTATLTVDSVVIEPGTSGTATVTMSATATHRGLTLTVPLSGLPTAFTVTAATLDGATCTIGASVITCTGVGLIAGATRKLNLAVTVAEGARSGTSWRATGVTLADPADAADKLVAAGLLVNTTAAAYTVSVTVGAPSVATPNQGQTTTLPLTVRNAGPDAANPYPLTVLLPAGTTHGVLPQGCAQGPDARIVVCQVTLAAGQSVDIALPVVVDGDATPDSTLSGGCVDQALSAGKPTFDYACGSDADVALPDLTVGRYDVDMGVEYTGPTVPAAIGGNLLVKLPYNNEGTEQADDVTFTITPPAGVTVTQARIMLDPVSGAAVNSAASASLVTVSCTGTGDANVVVCQAPDSAAQSGSELWLSLKVWPTAKTGAQKMKVTVSTTDADGYAEDNTTEVPLRIAAAADSGDGDGDGDGGDNDGGNGGDDDEDLPVTGTQVAGLALMSVLLMIGGVVLLTMVRDRRPVTVLIGEPLRREPGRHARAAQLPAAVTRLRQAWRRRRDRHTWG